MNATLSIRVQVMDEANRTLEKTFLIEVLDDPAEDLILPIPKRVWWPIGGLMKRMDPSPMIHPGMDTMLIYEGQVMKHG